MATASQRGASFTLTGWQADEELPAVHFDYECSRFGVFRETVSWPTLSGDGDGAMAPRVNDGIARLFDLLHIALGVSYYKCAAAPVITAHLTQVTPEARAMMDALYTDGLAEFLVRAGLPWPSDVEIVLSARKGGSHSDTPLPRPDPKQALVAFGGGKDSYVAAQIVDKAGVASELVSSVMSDKVADAIQRAGTRPVTFMRRRLDPKLKAANEQGAFNGHVPITAINSLMLVILGALTGAGQAIFANERSADEPTMDVAGVTANHQYSKSSFFEQKLRAAITAACPGAPDYFSILRPFSEIWIARAFAGLAEPKKVFTSCNRNFQIAGDDAPRWCGECAKCAFTSLMLAPHMTRSEAATVFPEIFPDKEALLPVYRELLGLTETKPWDCVGTIDECRATLWMMSRQEDWQDCAVVRHLLPEVLAENSPEQLEEMWTEGLVESERHFVPNRFMEAARAL